MLLRRIFSMLLAVVFLATICALPTFANNETETFKVDAINSVRNTEFLCVYQNIEHTGQNEWGYDILVNSDGTVVGKIPSGDLRGANLAVPQNGMVVSGNGSAGEKVYNATDVGDKCVFDETEMTIKFIKSESEVFSVNSINDTRWESNICVYRNIEHTNQNEWGENIIVDSDGIVIDKIPSGDLRGKNLAIPEGGMVVSGTNDIGKSMYDSASVGNKCIFDEYSMTVCFVKVSSKMFYVNSINGTRWENYICVYRDIEHTGQNEWGYNLVIDSEGNVTEKISSGDTKGKKLAVPQGGMVVSGTNDIGKSMYDSAEIGYKCLFDDYSMRIYFAKGAVNPFYKMDLRVTGYNSERWADNVIIYNKSGENTQTNVFGYEVCVNADGYIISAGGNNNVVPQGGYVISATEAKDTDILKMYFTVGAKCTLNTNSVTAEYNEAHIVKTVESEFKLAKEKLQKAKTQYKLINYATIEEKLAAVKFDEIKTIQERNTVISQIRDIDPMFVESRTVDTRCVWYTALETTKEEIKSVVAEIKSAGFNELVLSTDSTNGTLVPIDTQKIPFTRNPIAQELDVIQAYIDECRANDISIIILTPVMSNTYAVGNTEWLDVTNTGEERSEKFISPANSEYRKAYMDFLEFVITRYDVDGIQLDFIRYPQSYGNLDAGYDNATIKLFEEKTGLGEAVVREIGQQLKSHPQWSLWHDFKTELINSWVEDAYGLIRETCPELYVTAAVAASSGVSDYCQDPGAWLTNGYIDGIYVMSYVEGINESTVAQHSTHRGDKSYLVMGCGAYLSISNQLLIEQTDNSAVYGADGTGYFEWGAVKSHGYTDLLKNTLFKTSAIPFTADVKTVVKHLVTTAKARVELYCDSANSEKATKLRAIMSKLPDENADKATILTVLDEISTEIDEAEQSYLTVDLNSAIRAINMARYDISAPQNKKGDINGNGEIDTIDYLLLKRAYFATFSIDDISVADINDNGEIDTVDYLLLKRAYFDKYIIQ